MRRVRREALLRLESALKPRQHVVERVDQAPHLVIGAWVRQPRVQIALADQQRLADDSVHRAQDPAREQLADADDRRHQCEAGRNEQQRGALHHVVGVVEGARHLDRPKLAARMDRH